MYWKCSIPLAIAIKSNIHIHTETVVQKSFIYFEFNTHDFCRKNHLPMALSLSTEI